MNEYLFTGKSESLHFVQHFDVYRELPSSLNYLLHSYKNPVRMAILLHHTSGQGLLEGWPEQPYRIQL